MFDWKQRFQPLFTDLESNGQLHWADHIWDQLYRQFETHPHGDLERWNDALSELPVLHDVETDFNAPAITLSTPKPLSEGQHRELEAGLRGLMPWRKGPFSFFGIDIDTEWRSDWKWDRISPYISDLSGRRVLDVGCGSGYHCWRMAGAGASDVIGVDPGLLFLMQFFSVKDFVDAPHVHMIPGRLEDLPPKLEYFDTTFSMGVLYHRRSPLDHLLELRDTLRDGGELILETLVVDGPEGYSLMPEDRYGMMRNVWFLPSCDTLMRWLDRTGFKNARVVDVTVTTSEEQRSTDWMRFQSLEDFLDPQDPTKTVEGYPGPKRATIIADKG